MVQFKLFRLVLIVNFSFRNSQSLDTFASLDCTLGYSTTAPYCSWSSRGNWSKVSRQEPHDNLIEYNGPYVPLKNSGSYIYFFNSGGNYFPLYLTSTMLQSKGTTDCLSFYYYTGAESEGLILSIPDGRGGQSIWRRSKPVGDMWHFTQVNIGPQTTSYQLEFSNMRGYGSNGLGYLKTNPGYCSQDSLCEFESGNCNWTTTYSNPEFKFHLTNSRSDREIMTSNWDHSTESGDGHFMAASKGAKGDTTNLTSPIFNKNKGYYCFELWYWQISNSYLIEVITQNPLSNGTGVRWTSNSNLETNNWQRAQVPFYMNDKEQLIIRATQLSRSNSPLAIDDISLVPDNCDKPIDCDFNRDMCGWTQDLKKSWRWDHGVGRVQNAKLLPSTIKYAPKPMGGVGMYMYTDFTKNHQDLRFWDENDGIMVMKSEYVAATQGACLSFSYLALHFNNPNNKFMVILRDTSNVAIETIFTLGTTEPSSNWIMKNIDINTKQDFIVVFAVCTDSASTYLAIDDIKYKSGSCKAFSATRHSTSN